MTSDVKGRETHFYGGRHCLPFPTARDGASKPRRVILRIAVGWGPPSLPPSGAGRDRGPRVSFSRFTPSRTPPNRRCAPCGSRCNGAFVAADGLGNLSGVPSTYWAIAHMKATRSRAMATTTWGACVPRAMRCRYRLPRRTWAFQLMSWTSLGRVASCSGRCRRPLAGEREAQAPSMRARRAGSRLG